MGDGAETDLLRHASESVDSLISSSYSVKSFHSKWHLVREKLEKLSSGLAVAAGNQEISRSSPFSELLQAIHSAADDTQALLRRCSNESSGSSGGKLQMRSDLDIMAAKVDLHIKLLADVFASGALSDSLAIIIPQPGAGADRDDMRFYVRDLFSRLRIGGDSDMRARALAALNEVLHCDGKYARIAFIETDDGLGLLVGFLESGDAKIQEEAAEAVALLAGLDSYKGKIVTAGAIASLVRVLEMGTDTAKQRAARALMRLTENSDNAWSVSAHGGVTALLKICNVYDSGGCGDGGRELVGSSCTILRNLSRVGEIKKFMVEQGAVSIFLNLLRSNGEAFQIPAIEFLYIMASEDEAVKSTLSKEDIVQSLVRILIAEPYLSYKGWEVVLRAIEIFGFSSPEAVDELMASGFPGRVLFILKTSGESLTQELALKAATRLSGVSDEAKKEMGESGFIPVLIDSLEDKSIEVRTMAAELLCCLLSVHRNRKRFIQEDGYIGRVLRLLDPEEKTVAKSLLLTILMSLTASSGGRRKISGSGFVKNLEKLAETNVIDAKKIVKKINGNRLWNFFNGLWRF